MYFIFFIENLDLQKTLNSYSIPVTCLFLCKAHALPCHEETWVNSINV